MEGNIGNLLHKLTKYQTLMANTNSNQNRKTYQEKINIYSNKLHTMGINNKTLAGMSELIGGVINPDEIKATVADVNALKNKLAGLQSRQSGSTKAFTDLKEENDRLKKENDELKAEIVKYDAAIAKYTEVHDQDGKTIGELQAIMNEAFGPDGGEEAAAGEIKAAVE